MSDLDAKECWLNLVGMELEQDFDLGRTRTFSDEVMGMGGSEIGFQLLDLIKKVLDAAASVFG